VVDNDVHLHNNDSVHHLDVLCPSEKEFASSDETDFIPSTVCFASSTHNHSISPSPLFHVLFDSGSSHSYITRSSIPSAVIPQQLTKPHFVSTAAGPLKINQSVDCHHLTFPEFSKSLKYEELTCQVFDQADCNYDIILGRNFLIPAKLDLFYTDLTMRWHGRIVPMKVTNTPHSLYIDFADDPSDEMFVADIQGHKYEWANLPELAASQDHLTLFQRESLLELLQQHQSLFSGKSGKYTKRQLHLELKEGAQPVHWKPYPIPKAHEQLFKEEAGYLVSDGILEPVGATEHAYLTFITPKKDGLVRWVSDFQKLNAMLKQSIYPLPRIHDILTKQKCYQYFTKLDLSMQY
jgi:Retroviral aspartyl protease